MLIGNKSSSQQLFDLEQCPPNKGRVMHKPVFSECGTKGHLLNMQPQKKHKVLVLYSDASYR